jgi:regulator of sigma E protease
MLFTIIIFIIVLSVLVFVHELGHFGVARKMGVKVEEFGFGLPPRACGILRFHSESGDSGKKKERWKFFLGEHIPNIEGMVPDDTIYSINWLPLGGFCKIKGENGDGETDRDSFVSKKIWQRIAIISAGVIMNIILAMVIFSVGYMVGLPQSVDDGDSQKYIYGQKIMVAQVVSGTPAEKAGLKVEDAILSINGQEFQRDKDLQDYVATRAGETLDYKVEREGKTLDFQVVPEEKNGKGQIGVAIVNSGLVRYPWYLAIGKGITTSLTLLWVIIVAFYELLKNLIFGHGVSADISGPVGIATMTGQYAHMGMIYLAQFVALLSLNLAVVNFLPLPALDGGRIIFLLIEKFRGSPVKREVEAAVHNLGFIALLLLVLVITVNDVSRFTGPIGSFLLGIFK